MGEYDGIDIAIRKSDGKRYTLIVKDTLLPPNPDNGREQSTTSYEYDFVVESSAESTSIRIPWSSFNPTYRGREQKDANPLDTTRVRRISIMMRSFFGTQSGSFSLSLKSISAYKSTPDSKGSWCGPEVESGGGIPSGRGTPRRLGAPLTACIATMLAVVAVHVLYRRWIR